MPDPSPNILFFFPDQHRGDWLGGNPSLPLKTPNLDALAARGTRMENVVTPSPICAPARACLASGCRYDASPVKSNRENFPLDAPSYYRNLREADYHVCGVGKFDLHKDGRNRPADFDWHLDGSRNVRDWGFIEGIDNEGKLDGSKSYRDAGKPKGPYLNFLEQAGLAEPYVREHEERKKYRGAYITCLPEEAYCDNWIAENGLDFLRRFPEDRPWHLVVNFAGPHDPMDVTRRMHEEVKDLEFPPPVDNCQEEFDADDHQWIRRYYAAMIQNIDRQVGRFVEAVRERGELDNTLIVYASDHGEMLGDHSRFGKTTYYHPSVRVPCIAAGPGVAAGRRTSALVELQDLAATLLEVGGAKPLPGAQARSFRRCLAGEADAHREHAVSGFGDWRMIFDGRHKLVTELPGEPVLFDLREDPEERRNEAAENPETVRRLRNALDDATKQSSDQ